MTDFENSLVGRHSSRDLEIDGDDAAYLEWARHLGCDLEIKTPCLEPEDEQEFVPCVKGQVDDWFDENYVPVIDALWKKYVPKSGPCSVLQGEMSRCIGRLEGEYFKNGMINMGGGFYDQMVDKVVETVLTGDRFSVLVCDVLKRDALIVKGADYAEIVGASFLQSTDVEDAINRMKMVVAAWCIHNPDPIEC